MLTKILNDLDTRLASEISVRSPLKYLKNINFEDHIESIIGTVYLYTRPKRGVDNPKTFLTEVICALGRSFMVKEQMKKDSSLSAKTGAYILNTFERLKILKVEMGGAANGNQAYVINVIDDDVLIALWGALSPSTIQKIPSLVPYADWTHYRHETGALLVKTNHKIRKTITPENHPLVYEAINRSQKVGWNINKNVHELQLWSFRNRADAFNDVWKAHSSEARSTKIRETKAISSISERFLDETFYHLYYYDFRGRKYVSTAYLNEQGSDLAKGLLLRNDKKAIGEGGFFWLCVSIASNWGGDAGREDELKTDKIPLKDRYMWVLDNEEIMLCYAENPKVNQGWMKADKPWQFIAACFELMHLRQWQVNSTRSEVNTDEGIFLTDPDFTNYGYESGLEAYIDGSNNGSQHLSALMLDEVTAPHVNLVPLDLPGDLYMFVAHHIWDKLEKEVASMPNRAVKSLEKCIDTVIEMKKQINLTEPRSEHRQELVEIYKSYKLKNKEIIKRAAPVFWLRINEDKHKRKISKRGVMTLPYGAKPYGLGEQIIADCRKHGIEVLMSMEHSWGAYLGRDLFAVCGICLERPMRLLSTFEQAGKAAEQRGEFLAWNVPVTNFPVVQHYIEGEVKKTWVQYGAPKGKRLNTGYYENTYQLMISYLEHPKPSKNKQSQGAAPNIIHSLDAGHLVLTVCRAAFPVTTVHDSYGALLSDMNDLFRIVRETFVELYQTDPLTLIFKDIGADITTIEKGKLDLTLILDSEYAFA